MNMDNKRVLIILKNWWFSVLLLILSSLIIHQFYLTLARNILTAINYEYPPLFGMFFFVLKTVTLFIHEAGHTFFSFFGSDFLSILGGTLLQLMIPSLLLISTWMNRQFKATQFSLFWLGFSWLDTAAYCADAKFRDLPLIGNLPESAHDFYNMLSMLNILDSYRTIAWIFYVFGLICLISGILLPLFKKEKPDSIDLANQLEKVGLE